MSYSKDGNPPASYSYSPGQYQFSNYHTPSLNFYPPPLPTLPDTAQPPSVMHQYGFVSSHHGNGSPGASQASAQLQVAHHPGTARLPSVMHQHGFVSHYGNCSPGVSPGSAQLQVMHHHGVFAQGSSPGTSDVKDNTPVALGSDADAGSSRKRLAFYATPIAVRQHYYRNESYAQVLPTSTRKSPYFSQQPPPLPPVPALTVSPQDQKEPSTIYQNSPYFSEAPSLDAGSGSSESSASTTSGIRPAPAKSAFMCFSEAKRKAISDKIESDNGKGGFVEAVAAEWRSLSKQERAYWEGMAKNEKTRFAKEKESYKGPLTRKLRTKKNPLAPKRPMSAFLMYAQVKRRPLQKENPDMPNADISRLLGEIWRNTSMADKRPFLEREEAERKIYKAKVEAWKSNEKLAKSMKSPKTGVRKKLDQWHDVASFTREETHSNQNQGYEPAENAIATYPKGTSTHPERLAENQVGSPSYHEYIYDASAWTSTHNHHPSNLVKYSYPRPRDDHKF